MPTTLYREIKKVIKKGGDINAFVEKFRIKYDMQMTYLHYACRKNDIKSVKLLLKNNCDIEKKNGCSSAVYDALTRRHMKLFYLFLNSKRIKNLDQILSEAVFADNIEAVKILLNMGCDPLYKGINGVAIYNAIHNQNNEMFNMLLKYYPTSYLRSIIYRILDTQYTDNMLKKLLKRKDFYLEIQKDLKLVNRKKLYKILKFDPNYRDENGNTLLMLATRKRLYYRHKTIKKFLEDGFDINATNNHGNTVLNIHIQLNINIKFICRLIKNKNIDINIKNKKGQTPLHICALGLQGKKYYKWCNLNHVLRMLIKRSRNYNVRDNSNKIFIDYLPKDLRHNIKLLITRQYKISLCKQCILFIENNLTKFDRHDFKKLNKDIKNKFHISL